MKVIKHQAADGTLHDSAKEAFEHDAKRTIEVQVTEIARDYASQSDIVDFVVHNASVLRVLLNKALTRPRTTKQEG